MLLFRCRHLLSAKNILFNSHRNNISPIFISRDLYRNPLLISHHSKSVFRKSSQPINTCINGDNIKIQIFRTFKTSQPRYINPAVWLIVRPVLKLLALLTGRGFRQWWKNLPTDKKMYFYEQIKANRRKISMYLFLMLLSAMGYYVVHLEETPITKRRRFIAFNSKQLEEINEYELKTILAELGDQVLPSTHPATKTVAATVKRIIAANTDIKQFEEKKFGISVIDSTVENAFVLPIGHVIVFTGMMNLCNNHDQLGIIIAHEIAHSILNHGAENMSNTHILDMLSILIIAGIWAIIPSDYISLLVHWLYQQSIKILFELPYSRFIEAEADEVGLMLAAKACFDVRESTVFWNKMSFFQRHKESKDPDIKFLSTHPSHESRAEHLDSIMEDAIKLRSSCGCSRLSKLDPRVHFEAVSKDLERRKKLMSVL